MKEHQASLTGLRFPAAAMIVILHTGWLFSTSRHIKESIDCGAGVTFFYVLSGFILHYAYDDVSLRENKTKFFVARLARIWPLHLAGLCFTLAAFSEPWGYPGDASSTLKILTNAFLLQAWVPSAKYFFSLNGVSWSISVEMFFYLVFPFIANDWKRTGKVKLLIALGVAISIVTTAEILAFPRMDYGDPDLGSRVWATTILPLVRLPEFLVGISACHVWMRHKSWITERRPMTWTFVEGIALFAALVTLARLSSRLEGLGLGSITTEWLTRLGPAPVFALLIFAFASGHGYCARFMSIRPLVFLGKISFALYLTHELLIRVLVSRVPGLFSADPVWFWFLVFWMLALSIATMAWLLIEEPARRVIVRAANSWLAGRPVKSHVPAPLRESSPGRVKPAVAPVEPTALA